MRNSLYRLLPAVLLGVACLYTYRLEVPETHTYDAAGITALSATTQNGTISVAASPDTVITVNLLKRAYGRDSADASAAIANVGYSDTVIGHELRVKAEMPSSNRPYGADLTVTVPDSTGLSLSSTNDSISVTNTVGAINAATTNGSVELTGTTGTASVSTTNGSLKALVHRGAFYASTTNGAVDCDLASLGATENVGLATTNGKVTLLLPDDVSAVIDATDSTGIITIYDFTVVYDVQTEHHLHGRIGSGASAITITTTNGDIVVRRRS